MQTDRIAELRTLRRKMDEKFAQREPDKHIPYHKAKQAYEHAVEESAPALLDCAEALALIMEDPDARAALTPTQHDEGMAALARLNGDDHAG